MFCFKQLKIGCACFRLAVASDMDSMYTIFTEKFAWTTAEQTVGVFGTLIIGLIYGSLAGVISSIMVTLGSGQQDSMLKMLSLKAWMKARGLKKVHLFLLSLFV